MHIIKPYSARVYYVGVHGLLLAYESAAQAIAINGSEIIRHLIGHGVGKSKDGYGYNHSHALLGENGKILQEADCPTLSPRKKQAVNPVLGDYGVSHPGHKRSHGSCYRRPKTTQERRQNALVCVEDGEPPIRSSRKLNRLPNAWDDFARSDIYSKSWKRHRAHQYKESRR